MKQNQYCNKFNKDFKNGPHQKTKKKKKKRNLDQSAMATESDVAPDVSSQSCHDDGKWDKGELLG